MFWLSLLIFGIAFTYITVIGMNNILRYYHIQNIQDRMRVLLYRRAVELPDDDGRDTFLHWDEYKAPITTMHPMHVTSTHTLFYYISYLSAVIFISHCCSNCIYVTYRYVISTIFVQGKRD